MPSRRIRSSKPMIAERTSASGGSSRGPGGLAAAAAADFAGFAGFEGPAVLEEEVPAGWLDISSLDYLEWSLAQDCW
jgi:hypothetical protein